MVLPPAHLADHWAIYIAYSMPAIVVLVAIVSSAFHERGRRREQGPEDASPEARPDDDRARP